MLKDRLQKSMGKEQVEKNPILGIRQEIKNTVLKEITLFKGEMEEEIRRILEERVGRDGLTTLKGDDGFEGKEGSQGQVGPQGKVGSRGLPGPKGPKGDDGSSDTPEEVIAKINKSSKKIKAEQIDGLIDSFNKIQKKGGGSSSGGGGGSWYQKVLTGAINSSNIVFTFSGPRASQYSERVFLNYVEQNPVNLDYTINYTTNTITYAVAPDTSLSALPHLIRYHT